MGVGCAVLTVDVDVYKGSLANHEDVQIEQMAVMAIGAKPLLIQVRDELEIEKRKELKNSGSMVPFVDIKKDRDRYKARHIPTIDGQSYFYDENANRMNSVLYLYEDKSTRLTQVIDDGRQALYNFRQEWRIFGEPSSEEGEREFNSFKNSMCSDYFINEPVEENIKLWKQELKIKKHYRNNLSKAAKSLMLEAKKLEVEGIGKGKEKHGNAMEKESEGNNAQIEIDQLIQQIVKAQLFIGYRNFFTNRDGFRYDSKIIEAQEMIYLNKDNILAPQNVFGTFNDNQIDRSANAFFKALTDSSIVENHTKYLFNCKKNSNIQKERKHFEQRVIEIAFSFMKSRQSIENLLEATLVGIEKTGLNYREKANSEVMKRVFQHPAEFVVEIINLRDLATVLSVAETHSRNVPKELVNLSRNLQKSIPIDGFFIVQTKPIRDASGKWDTDSPIFNVYRDAVIHEIIQRPYETAIALQSAHSFFKSNHLLNNANIIQNAGLGQSFTSAIKRAFGISVGPSAEFDAAKVVSQASNTLSGFKHGLERGRLDLGLETLIESYLNSSYQNRDSIHIKQEQLINALIRFASKLLPIANYTTLISPLEEKGLLDNTVDITRRGLLGNEKGTNEKGTNENGAVCDVMNLSARGIVGKTLDSSLSLLFGKSTPPGNEDSYIRVLQAVGNSILTQANELITVKGYKKQLKDHYATELEALKRSLKIDPKITLDNLIKSLEQDVTDANEKAEKLTVDKKKMEEAKAVAQKAKVDAEKNVIKAKAEVDDLEKQLKGLKSKHKIIINAKSYFIEEIVHELKKRIREDDAALVNNSDDEDAQTEIITYTERKIAGKMKDLLEPRLNSSGLPDLENIPDAIDYLNLMVITKSLNDNIKMDSDTAIDSIIKRLQRSFGKVENKIKPLADNLIEEKTDLGRALETLEVKKSEKSIADANLKNAQEKLNTSIGEKAKKVNAVKAVQNIQYDLLEEIDTTDAGGIPSDVYSRIRRLINERKTKAEREKSEAESEKIKAEARLVVAIRNNDATEKSKAEAEKSKTKAEMESADKTIKIYGDAAISLEGREAPTDPIDLANFGLKEDDHNAKDVTDALIAALRYEHVQAVRESGAKEGRAKHIAAALNAAYAHRANMVHIRPASSYLRTSYPSTSLQSDPNLSWDNMLGQQGARSLPFAARWHGLLNPNKNTSNLINTDIDKQFWQNVNRVRVAGGGKTNYVVAKDDIGNWYVKSYSADPKPIIESAKNLALLGLSGKMGINLNRRILEAQKEGANGESDNGQSSKGQLESLLLKYEIAYNTQTAKDGKLVVELLGESLPKRLEDAWMTNEFLKQKINELKIKRDDATKLYLKEPIELLEMNLKEIERNKKLDYHTTGELIIGVLHGSRRFHNQLIQGIRDLYLTKADKQNLKTADDKLKKIKGELTAAEKKVEKEKENYTTAQNNLAKAKEPLPVTEQSVDTVQDILKMAHEEEQQAKKKLETAEEMLVDKKNEKAAAEKELKEKRTTYDSAVNGEKVANRFVSTIVHEMIEAVMNNRNDAVQDYETAVMFLGDANGN